VVVDLVAEKGRARLWRQFSVCLDDHLYGFFQVFALRICAGQFLDIADPPVTVSFEYCCEFVHG
jgi:hypothetical protein